MGKLFGTDGVRGIANYELSPELAFNLGKAGAFVLAKHAEKPNIIIAKDTRISGDMLEAALTAGLLSMGANVLKIGVLPTPAVAYLIKHYKADAGVVISASHNPFEYNGIKFFNQDGFKLDDVIEEEIEDIILNDIKLEEAIIGSRLGICREMNDALEIYSEFLKSTVKETFDSYKIVIDCANGASYKVAERTLKGLGATVIAIHNKPNGININDKCGSTHPNDLQKHVLEEKADLGFAYDGDADRLIAVDENGKIVNGDQLIYICSKMLKEEGVLAHDLVTATVMSNIGFYHAIKQIGCSVSTTQVGDRYVLESMLQTGSIIGGEQSGHIIFLNHTTTGDGVLSSLQLLSAVKRSGKKLSELAEEVEIYPQVLRNARVKNENKQKYEQDEIISAEIKNLEEVMHGEGRVLIRPSGTEPLVRVMIEGKDQTEITRLAEELAKLIEARLG